MSVHPRFVELIFTGKKKFELRRRGAGLNAGDIVYVYATSPEMALRGRFIVNDVLHEQLPALWNRVRNGAGISKEQFDEYFQGKERGFAISVRDEVLLKPVPLTALRKVWPGFQPPQSYRYLASQEAASLARIGRLLLPMGPEPIGARGPRARLSLPGR